LKSGAHADVRGGAAWIVFGLAILIGALRMDRFEAMGATLYTAPGLVPGIFGLLLIVLGGVLMSRGWRRARAAAVASEPLFNRRIAIMLVLALGYAAVLVGRVPFTAATAAFVALFTFVFAATGAPMWRRIGVALVSGVLTAAAIVLVFERIFLVRLP
jgi:hypothetical protein